MAADVAAYNALLEGPATAFAPASERHGRGAASAALLVGCLLLAGYVGTRLYHEITVITPEAAYLSSELHPIMSPASGRVVFLADPGSAEAGEPVFGIETATGKTVFVDAPDSTTIVGQQAAAGGRIERGAPVLTTASGNPTLYLRMVVPRSDAFRIGAGAVLHYTTLEADHPVERSMTLDAARVLATPLPADPARVQDPLFVLRVPVGSDGVIHTGASAVVSIDLGLRDGVESALSRLGLPPDLATHLAALLPSATESTP